MSTPDTDIVNHLDSALGTLTKGTNLFRGPVRPVSSYIPGEAVFCLSVVGFRPLAIIGQTLSNYSKQVQIRIRSDKNDYAGGYTLAKSILTTLHFASVTGDNYYDVRVREDEPGYLGVNEDDYHEWSLNVELFIIE